MPEPVRIQFYDLDYLDNPEAHAIQWDWGYGDDYDSEAGLFDYKGRMLENFSGYSVPRSGEIIEVSLHDARKGYPAQHAHLRYRVVSVEWGFGRQWYPGPDSFEKANVVSHWVHIYVRRLPPEKIDRWAPHGTKTGRLSSKEPNLTPVSEGTTEGWVPHTVIDRFGHVQPWPSEPPSVSSKPPNLNPVKEPERIAYDDYESLRTYRHVRRLAERIRELEDGLREIIAVEERRPDRLNLGSTGAAVDEMVTIARRLLGG